MDFEHIKKELGLEDCSCLSCCHCRHETDGDYGEIDWGWRCDKEGREFVSNLKSFPFKKNQECFFPEFWLTRFAENINGEDKHDNQIYASYRRTLRELGFVVKYDEQAVA